MGRRRKRSRRGCKWSKWSQEENLRLQQLVSENGGNLMNAFRIFNEEYPDRTLKAALEHWYFLKKTSNLNVCMITIDKRHKHVNGKNVRSYTTQSQMRPSLWNRILNLIFGSR